MFLVQSSAEDADTSEVHNDLPTSAFRRTPEELTRNKNCYQPWIDKISHYNLELQTAYDELYPARKRYNVADFSATRNVEQKSDLDKIFTRGPRGVISDNINRVPEGNYRDSHDLSSSKNNRNYRTYEDLEKKLR